jgi:hypothetical protein
MNKKIRQGIFIVLIITFIFITMSPSNLSKQIPTPTLRPPPPGVVFVMDCSSSIDSSERAGMRTAIIAAVSKINRGLTFSVIKFSETAQWGVYPRIINNAYDLQNFINEVNCMSLSGQEYTAMYTGVLLAKGAASYMIIMTDQCPGDMSQALDACTAARILGQKISIAYYPHEDAGYFPFSQCTNSVGQYPDQPIGYYSLVMNSSAMISKVRTWMYNEFSMIGP